jgi:16S rRNA (adenine1518-N6/adenine1519-N6)-dimethyltransferase
MDMASSDRRFMVDEEVLDEVVGYASLVSGDSVLEVGGGTGNLTERISKKAGVTVIESDRRLAESLARRFKDAGNVRTVHADAVKAPYPPYNKIVSNIPYSVSRSLLERFVAEGFDVAVLVVQKEFADKLEAKPMSNNYRMISALVQGSCELERLRDIPPEAFSPRPTVMSSCVRLRQSWKPPKEYAVFLKTLFSLKNKKIRNIMAVSDRYSQLRPVEMTPQELRAFYLDTHETLLSE